MSVRALILGTAFLLAPVRFAAAQSVTFAGVNVELSDRSWQDTESAVIAGRPFGDVGYIFEFELSALATPVDGGTRAAGAWLTAYVPDGLEVVGAEIIGRTPVGRAVASPSAAGPAPNGYGLELPSFESPWDDRSEPACDGVGSTCAGTLLAPYSDTGVFFSEAIETSLQPPQAIAPAHVGAAEVGNAWDASQVSSFGAELGGGASAVASTIGALPFGAGSPVAGPESAVWLDASAGVGPWRRVHSFGASASAPVVATGSGSSVSAGSPTGLGVTATESQPLPADTNALRFAVGSVAAGDVVRARVRLRVTEPLAPEGVLIVAEAWGGSQAGLNFGNPWSFASPVRGAASTAVSVRTSLGDAGSGLSSATSFELSTEVLVNGLGVFFAPELQGTAPDAMVAELAGERVGGTDIFPMVPEFPMAGEEFGHTMPPALVGGTLIRFTHSFDTSAAPLVAPWSLDWVGSEEALTWTSSVSRQNRALLLASISTEAGLMSARTPFRVELTNNGLAVSSGFELFIELPTGFELDVESLRYTALPSTAPEIEGTGVRWSFTRDVAPGESAAIEFDLLTDDAGDCTEGIAQLQLEYPLSTLETRVRTQSTSAYASLWDFDGDGLSNSAECEVGSDPTLEDTDEDGCTDFVELSVSPPTSPLLRDTDQGGAEDCDEILMGLDGTVPWDDTGFDYDEDGLDNDVELGVFGSDPLLRDTDDGGATDSEEFDAGTDPRQPFDDPGFDYDDDGLPNELEAPNGGLPNEEDTDGDGCLDGFEVFAETPSSPASYDTDEGGVDDCTEHLDGSDPSEPSDDPGFDFDGDLVANEVELEAGSDPRLRDTDSDGCDDGVEILGTPTSDPTLRDTDEGGVEDCDERDDGTDPNVPSDDVGFDFDSDGLNNDLEALLGGDPMREDTDGDGCNDLVEYEAGTRLDVRDTDEGGTEDCFEIVEGTNPLDPFDDLDGDPDADGLTTREEGDLGTNPRRFDTDGDGCSDGDEVRFEPRSDPSLPDTDFGGAGDCEERAEGTDPTVPFDDIGFDWDEDGLANERELLLRTDPADEDSDDDGCLDGAEVEGIPATDPNNFDTDDGGIGDCQELADGTDPTSIWDDIGGDGDHDGLTNEREPEVGANPRIPDTDGDGCLDGEEMALERPTRPDIRDSDSGGRSDCEERADGTDPWNRFDDTGFDADFDGLDNDVEIEWGSDPSRADSDGGGTTDNVEWELELDPTNPDDDPGADPDEDGLTNEEEFFQGTDPLNPDTDGDGRTDGEEVNGDVRSDPLNPDSDGGGATDGDEVNEDETDPTNPEDDVGYDFDGDGLSNEEEFALGTDPANPDSDGDGRTDGEEVYGEVTSDPTDPDSDGGGADDGTEVNIDETNPFDPTDDVGFDFDSDGFENSREPNMGLDPANPDTDFDGLCDGNVGVASGACVFGEDLDIDGTVDPGESNPRLSDTDGGGVDDGTEHLQDGGDFRNPQDDDPDRDRLTNLEERYATTDPNDADSDDDGLLDGEEVAFETDPLNRDTDGDLLQDGTEVGVRRPHADTDQERFIADADPLTVTDPLNPDTDGGGIDDGLEDLDRNGAVGAEETDPRDADDDRVEGCLSRRDCDGDRLPDTFERSIGTDPKHRDSDGDGIDDGTEVLRLPALNPLDADTDQDGLCDGSIDIELVCVAGEDLSVDGFLDPGETDPTEPDSDFGGVPDGVEVGRGTDPLDPSDDASVEEGCGCSSTPRDSGWSLVLLALFALRRRSR